MINKRSIAPKEDFSTRTKIVIVPYSSIEVSNLAILKIFLELSYFLDSVFLFASGL